MNAKATTLVKFDVSIAEGLLIRKIARRAVAKAAELGIEYAQQWAEMDLTACHRNGCPLDLRKLLEFDDASFAHDVFGIRRFLNRQTGQLGECFDPRSSLPAAA